MQSKKDLALLVKAAGGNTGAVDVTLGLSVWGDMDPPDTDDGGTPVDIDAFTNLTPAVYRVDQGVNVLAPEVTFTGATEINAWLDLDGLNADRLRIRLTFSDTPILATPAKILIKARRDAL